MSWCYILPWLLPLLGALLGLWIGWIIWNSKWRRLKGDYDNQLNAYNKLQGDYDLSVNNFSSLENKHLSLKGDRDALQLEYDGIYSKYNGLTADHNQLVADRDALNISFENYKRSAQTELDDWKGNYAKLKTDYESLVAAKKESDNTIERLKKDNAGLKAELDKLRADLNAQIEALKAELDKEKQLTAEKDARIAELEALLAKLQQELADLQAQSANDLQAKADQLLSLQGNFDTLQLDANAKGDKIDGLEATIRTLGKDLEDANANANQAKADADERYRLLLLKLEEAEGELENRSGLINNLTEEKNQLNLNFDSFKTDSANQLSLLQGNFDDLQSKSSAGDAQIAELEAALAALKADASAERDRLNAELADLRKQYDALVAAREESSARIVELQNLNEGLSDDLALQKEIAAEEKARLDGLLSDLQAKYDALLAAREESSARLVDLQVNYDSLLDAREGTSLRLVELQNINGNLSDDLALQKEIAAEEKARLDGLLSDLQAKYDALLAAREESSARLVDLQVNYDTLLDAREGTSLRLVELQDMNGLLSDDLTLQKEIAVEDKARLEAALGDLQKKYDALAAANEAANQKIATLGEEKNKLGQSLDSLNLQFGDLQAKEEAGGLRIVALEAANGELKDELTLQKEIAAEEKAGLETLLAGLQERYDKLNAAAEENKRKVSELEALIADLRSKAEENKRKVSELEALIADLKSKNADLSITRDENSARIAGLESGRIRLEEELEVQKEIAAEEKANLEGNLASLRKQYEDLLAARSEMEAQLKALEVKKGELSDALTLQKEINEEEKAEADKAYADLLAKFDALNAEKEATNASLLGLRGDFDGLNSQYNGLVKSSEAQGRKVAELQDANANLIASLSKERDNSANALRAAKAEYGDLKGQYNGLAKTVDAHGRRVKELQDANANLIASLSKERDNSANALRAAKAEYGDLKGQYDGLAKTVDAHGRRVKELQDANANLIASLSGERDNNTAAKRAAKAEYNDLLAKYNALLKELEAAKGKLGNLKGELENLESAKDKMGDRISALKAAEEKAKSKLAEKEDALRRVREKAKSLDFAKIGVAKAEEKDDLKRIKGIGPFIEEKLNAVGIYQFRQIANLEGDMEDKVNDAIEFFPGRVKRDEWVRQAREILGIKVNDKEAEALRRVREKAKNINFNRIGKVKAGEKDDLQKIKGIGPFIERKLNAVDIYTFRQIANFNEEDEEMVNDAIEFFPGRISRDEWARQAKKLMGQDIDSEDNVVLNRIKSKKSSINFGRIGTANAGEKDDLQRIKGIGAFIERKLNTIDIFTFRQIANFDSEDEDKVNDAIEFFSGRIKRDQWVKQARGFMANAKKGAKSQKQAEALKRIQEKAGDIDFGRIGFASELDKDNLQDINGIGPYIEDKLNALGIYTFEQISKFTADDELKVNEAIEFFPGRVKRDEWVKQAREFFKAKKKK